MAKGIERIIEIPAGIDASVKDGEILIKGKGKEAKRKFDISKAIIKVEGDKIKISSKRDTLRESKIIGTTWAHINNMIKGLNEDFVYELEICNIHFPMNVKVEGDIIIIKSFLGEKKDRVAKIMPGATVDIKGSKITVSSHSIESAGQTAGNIEKATKLTGRDRRIFQDGIYITSKCGEKI